MAEDMKKEDRIHKEEIEKEMEENLPDEASKVEEAAEKEETGENEEVAGSGSGEAGTEFKSKSREEKDPKEEKIQELTDMLQRQRAEFENFRKRTEKEKASMYTVGAREFIEKLLPVVDNFERGLAVISEEDKNDPIAEGMEMIYKQLVTVLEDAGVKAIEAKGSEFDPSLHNAVMHEENDEVGENIIVEEFQKGYTFKDSVVRHSMVKVAN